MITEDQVSLYSFFSITVFNNNKLIIIIIERQNNSGSGNFTENKNKYLQVQQLSCEEMSYEALINYDYFLISVHHHDVHYK